MKSFFLSKSFRLEKIATFSLSFSLKFKVVETVTREACFTVLPNDRSPTNKLIEDEEKKSIFLDHTG